MTESIFNLAVLVMSVVVHEVSHGFAARALGDRTAEYNGRLTLNPISHVDIWGSLIIPILLLISKASFIVGWAKPVPVNPYNFNKGGRWGEAIVAGAGPVSNLALAFVFGLIIRFGLFANVPAAESIIGLIVFINILLAVFNLVPIPPMDGSKILFAFLPSRFSHYRLGFERFGVVLAIIFIVFFWKFLYPVVAFLFLLITGGLAF